MVADTNVPMPDDFEGNGEQPAAEVTVTMPVDGSPSGAMAVQNPGLTEADLPEMPQSPSFTPSGPQPVQDPRLPQVMHQIDQMRYQHERQGADALNPDFLPGKIDVGAFVRAQGRYIKEKTAFYRNSGGAHVTDRMYIDLLNRHSFEQDAYIDALQNMLHQLGII
jgi:hypothetical protein